MWTQFYDMHSGGGSKEKYELIYIEAPQSEAEIIFYNRFGHNPNRVSCTCCGNDYSISEDESLGQLTAFHRNCDFDSGLGRYVELPNTRYGNKEIVTLAQYMQQSDVLIIKSEDIKAVERIGELPAQGYIWH